MEFNGDASHFAVTGELTIKGITGPITLDGEFYGSVIDAYGRKRIALAIEPLHASLCIWLAHAFTTPRPRDPHMTATTNAKGAL
jgi:hypothetical protein